MAVVLGQRDGGWVVLFGDKEAEYLDSHCEAHRLTMSHAIEDVFEFALVMLKDSATVAVKNKKSGSNERDRIQLAIMYPPVGPLSDLEQRERDFVNELLALTLESAVDFLIAKKYRERN